MPETPAQCGAAETNRIGRPVRSASALPASQVANHWMPPPGACSPSSFGGGPSVCPGGRAEALRRPATCPPLPNGGGPNGGRAIGRLLLLLGGQDLLELPLDLLLQGGDLLLLLGGQVEVVADERRQDPAQLEAGRAALLAARPPARRGAGTCAVRAHMPTTAVVKARASRRFISLRPGG